MRAFRFPLTVLALIALTCAPLYAQGVRLAPVVAPSFAAEMGGQTAACPATSATTIDLNKAFRACVTQADLTNVSHLVVIIDRPGTLTDQTFTQPVSIVSAGEAVFDLPAQSTTGSYSIKACARNVDPTDATNFSEKCSVSLAFTVGKPVMPAPTVAPTIRLSGVLTVAGVAMPAEFVGEIVGLRIGQ
jgi:hypothetical protein